jgi:hypothetical protein
MYTEDGNRIKSKYIIHGSYLGDGVRRFYLALWQIPYMIPHSSGRLPERRVNRKNAIVVWY